MGPCSKEWTGTRVWFPLYGSLKRSVECNWKLIGGDCLSELDGISTNKSRLNGSWIEAGSLMLNPPDNVHLVGSVLLYGFHIVLRDVRLREFVFWWMIKTSLTSRITYQPSISPLKEHENCMIYPLMMYRFQHFRQDHSIISAKATRHVLI